MARGRPRAPRNGAYAVPMTRPAPEPSVPGARVTGVDVARGLAVLGMFAAHVGSSTGGLFTATGWLDIADGRSATLFALLAGVSIALMSGGTTPLPRDERGTFRARLLVRAALLFLLGLVLTSLGAPIAVILPSYAVMFVLALPLVVVRPTTALAAGVGVLAVVPFLLAGPDPARPRGFLLELLAGTYYPALSWVGYVLVGIGIGRLPLGERATQTRLLIAGAALAVVGYGGGLVAARLTGLDDVLSLEPHADTTPEMLGNCGFAVVVLAGSLLACRVPATRAALRPLAATGSMPLTVYTAQIVTIAVLGPGVVLEPASNAVLVAFTLVTLAVCTLWVRYVGRGPLERAIRSATHALVPPAPPEPPPPGGPAVAHIPPDDVDDRAAR